METNASKKIEQIASEKVDAREIIEQNESKTIKFGRRKIFPHLHRKSTSRIKKNEHYAWGKYH